MPNGPAWCSALKEAAANGSDLPALAEKLAQRPAAEVAKAVAFLQGYGLLCKVPGYSQWVYVATEYSASFYCDPDALSEASSQQLAADPGGALVASSLVEPFVH